MKKKPAQSVESISPGTFSPAQDISKKVKRKPAQSVESISPATLSPGQDISKKQKRKPAQSVDSISPAPEQSKIKRKTAQSVESISPATLSHAPDLSKRKKKKSRKKRSSNDATLQTEEQTIEQITTTTDSSTCTDEKRKTELYRQYVEQETTQMLKKPWYHGLMPRVEIEQLLENDGDFLIRKTEVGLNERLAVSYKFNNHARHSLFELNKSNQWYLHSDHCFETIEALINHYMTTKSEFKKEGCKLLKPISRPDWCILHEHIKLGKKVGSGSFGDVFLAELTQDDKKIEVAVKTLRGKMGKKERSEFVKEASLNRRLKHPNIVQLIGIASQCVPLMVVLELANGGSLKKHVKEKEDLPLSHLTKYLLDAAKGLEYLSKVPIIHRDVAARNCLLDTNLTVKISDFGLSIATKELKETKLSKVPIRWLAPETLRSGVFSDKTDVWSFGIMMWEVYSRCQTDPYPGMSNSEAKAAIMAGNLMSVPKETPEEAADVMRYCWLKNPEDRASFTDLVSRLEQVLGTESTSQEQK